MKNIKFCLFLLLMMPVAPVAGYIYLLTKIFKMDHSTMREYLTWIESIHPEPKLRGDKTQEGEGAE